MKSKIHELISFHNKGVSKTKPTLLIILLIAFATANSFSQIPNSGFENWTNFGNYMDPNDWMTTNSSATGSFYPVTRDASHYPASVGLYSVRMESKPSLLPGSEALGVVVSGTSFNLVPDFLITGHPNSLTGYYKYAPLNGDTMHIFIALFDNTTYVAAGIFETTAAAPNWTSFNIPISGYATANNAKIYIGAYNLSGSPPQYVPYGNSVLNIDNLNFDSLIIAGISDIDETNQVFVYPNPSNGKFNIKSEIINGEISVCNLLGEKVYTSIITNEKMEIDLSDKANGIYFIKIISETNSGKVITNGKIVIE